MSGQKPREIAAQVLGRRRTGGDFTEDLLERALARAALSSVDRGLCHELVMGVVRWQASLDLLITRKAPGRTQKETLQDLLRLGLYQIFWLDRIPPHAAVNETVELARRMGFGPQAGFVNALLRGYLREAAATRQFLSELKTRQPALGWSHPDWLVQRWRGQFGETSLQRLLAWNNTPARTFARANSLKAEPGKLLERWREEGVDYDFCNYDWSGENLVFELKAHPSLAELGSFKAGWFYVQDPSTLLAVRELDPRPGEQVLDLCAAPGGKTTYAAQLMNNQGRIVAQDPVASRVGLLRQNCERMNAKCVEIVPPSTNPPLLLPTFDKVLVDAPCSNTGVLRRRADLRWRLQPEEIDRLSNLQLDLLLKAARAVRAGGVLVYSTCSLEPEENPGVVQRFLAESSGFALERERNLAPVADGVDGAFVARLKRA